MTIYCARNPSADGPASLTRHSLDFQLALYGWVDGAEVAQTVCKKLGASDGRALSRKALSLSRTQSKKIGQNSILREPEIGDKNR